MRTPDETLEMLSLMVEHLAIALLDRQEEEGFFLHDEALLDLEKAASLLETLTMPVPYFAAEILRRKHEALHPSGTLR